MTDRLDDPRSDARDDVDARASGDATDAAANGGAQHGFDTLVVDEPDVVEVDDGLDPAREGEPDEEPRPAWWRRAVTRMVRRPVAWLTAPWPTERVVRVVFTVFTLATTTAVMMNVVHLNPLSSARDLVFDDTTPTGGDFGAHVWGPAFLRDHLLPNWRFNGWSMDWYAGMP